ncbi:MAG: manganese efflux pump MntP family protein [Candidatus Bathyarchaeota archaeon]|nr:manganese efflux pump MntP family protein [Candidatus Bathyarchaeota archaeon]
MDIITMMLIAAGLAMDAFAVSMANGMATPHQKKKNALIMASFFGSFQMLMPIVGWLAGLAMAELISGVDHWIAFSLLTFIGGKMIYESTRKEDRASSNLRLRTLLTLSFATSIDALMVGLSFAFLQTSLALPIIIIGLVTFSLSFTGFSFGSTIGKIFGNKIKAVGGIILIIIGIKILLEHIA